jgi:uncharacterized protein YqgC (DUF456 family)
MPPDELLITLLSFAVMLVGLVGVVIPGIPDVPLIWLTAITYGYLTGWDGWLGGGVIALHTVLTIVGVIVDFALGPVAAKRGGASWQAILVSSVLGLVGLFVFPPFGAIIGALLGMFLVEYRRRGQNVREAVQAVKDYAIGFGLSVIVRFIIGIIMIVAWGVWVFLG